MLKMLYQSVVSTLILVLIVCGIYPILVTVLGQALFHDQANGSLVSVGGTVVGSRLIGQGFSKPEYFHGRPSSAGEKGYDASNSSGSNLGPTNQKLADALKANVDSILKDNTTLKKGQIPADLITASGSGLDPHISPDGAMVQVDRVAVARRLPPQQVKELVQNYVKGPQLGFLGEATVNVFELNLALDQIAKKGK